jgi:hypothetical protein
VSHVLITVLDSLYPEEPSLMFTPKTAGELGVSILLTLPEDVGSTKMSAVYEAAFSNWLFDGYFPMH